jgi:CspA family cold shock protein
MRGTVKFFNTKKGFGFISGEDGQDYFLHISQLAEQTINQNDTVEFNPVETNKGNQAHKVILVQNE